MDKTLLSLLVLALALIAFIAPNAVMTLLAIGILAVVATRGSWALLQILAQDNETQPVAVRQRVDY